MMGPSSIYFLSLTLYMVVPPSLATYASASTGNEPPPAPALESTPDVDALLEREARLEPSA
ncbi:MAG TPA: hypothetical protein VHE35_13855 [Kofleriaceae bacterium]|nr:hypothetical protein [Kofleriaceae bacterium]